MAGALTEFHYFFFDYFNKEWRYAAIENSVNYILPLPTLQATAIQIFQTNGVNPSEIEYVNILQMQMNFKQLPGNGSITAKVAGFLVQSNLMPLELVCYVLSLPPASLMLSLLPPLVAYFFQNKNIYYVYRL